MALEEEAVASTVQRAITGGKAFLRTSVGKREIYQRTARAVEKEVSKRARSAGAASSRLLPSREKGPTSHVPRPLGRSRSARSTCARGAASASGRRR